VFVMTIAHFYDSCGSSVTRNVYERSSADDEAHVIEIRKPTEPRWARRKGDLLLRMGRKDDAALAFERAARLYAARGFEARASAMAKLVQTLNPV